MVRTELLKDFPIFHDLNERELELIAAMGEEETRETGTRIFEEKALAKYLYLVLEGKVELKIRGEGDKHVVVDRAGPGDVFGWSAVTEPHTFTAGAWTAEKTCMIYFEGEILQRLFESNNHIGYRVLKEILTIVSRRLKARETELVRSLSASE